MHNDRIYSPQSDILLGLNAADLEGVAALVERHEMKRLNDN